MKIYNTKTQAAYDALMTELEEQGFNWINGKKPTYYRYWEQFKENTCIEIVGKEMTVGSLGYYKEEYPNETIIEYKAKGETKMTNEEMKQNIHGLATHVSIAAEYLARDIKFEMKKSTVEADLKEAKSSAKNLIEKIDEYLENLKPKFKVGDYVVEDEKYITKIEKINSKGIPKGHFYDREINHLSLTSVSVSSSTARLATPEEIVEYKVALIFYKHGRKPFEVKEGDLIEYPNGHNIMIYYPEIFSKADFLNDGFKLIKTAEEVNEWLGAEDE